MPAADLLAVPPALAIPPLLTLHLPRPLDDRRVPNPDMRPTFTVILEAVLRLREELGGVTPPLRRYTPPRPGDRRNALQEVGWVQGQVHAPGQRFSEMGHWCARRTRRHCMPVRLLPATCG